MTKRAKKTCPHFNSTDGMETITFTVEGKTYSREIRTRECHDCHGKWDETALAIASVYAEVGPVTNEAFRIMVDALPLTDKQLAPLLDLAAETIGRIILKKLRVSRLVFYTLGSLVLERTHHQIQLIRRLNNYTRSLGITPRQELLDLER